MSNCFHISYEIISQAVMEYMKHNPSTIEKKGSKANLTLTFGSVNKTQTIDHKIHLSSTSMALTLLIYCS